MQVCTIHSLACVMTEQKQQSRDMFLKLLRGNETDLSHALTGDVMMRASMDGCASINKAPCLTRLRSRRRFRKG